MSRIIVIIIAISRIVGNVIATIEVIREIDTVWNIILFHKVGNVIKRRFFWVIITAIVPKFAVFVPILAEDLLGLVTARLKLLVLRRKLRGTRKWLSLVWVGVR